MDHGTSLVGVKQRDLIGQVWIEHWARGNWTGGSPSGTSYKPYCSGRSESLQGCLHVSAGCEGSWALILRACAYGGVCTCTKLHGCSCAVPCPHLWSFLCPHSAVSCFPTVWLDLCFLLSSQSPTVPFSPFLACFPISVHRWCGVEFSVGTRHFHCERRAFPSYILLRARPSYLV